MPVKDGSACRARLVDGGCHMLSQQEVGKGVKSYRGSDDINVGVGMGKTRFFKTRFKHFQNGF